MSRIQLNYSNYAYGRVHFDFLNNYINGSKKNIKETKERYSEIDDSIFETSSFPISSYLDDFYKSIEYSGNLIEIGNELAQYAVDNFNGAEEAIEEEINKFKNKMEELFGNISFDGFHFGSEKLAYWEPGIDGYTSQGYTETDKYKVISAYRSGENSRLYYYDKETGEYIGYVELNNQDHVGGIAYDQDDKLMFVTGSDGKVNCYDHKAIEQFLDTGHRDYSNPIVIDLNKREHKGIEVECNINIKDELRTDDAATIYYHDGKLYVATYRSKGDLVSYNINCNRQNNGKIDLDVGQMDVVSHDCPSATQGITIFERNGKKYVAFSRSAKLSPSSIDVYELNEGDEETLGDFSGSMLFPHQGLEGIDVHDDGTVTGIYEFEGATTLDVNIDNIIDNGRENPEDLIYRAKARIWNTVLHGLDNANYEEAIALETVKDDPHF